MIRQRWWIWTIGAFILSLQVHLLSGSAIASSPPIAQLSPPLTQSTERAALEERIRQLRMGEVVVKVVDRAGHPIPNARVHLAQTAHAFEFGVALATEMFAPTVEPSSQRQYLGLVQQLFNASVPENALKWYATELQRGQVSYADADRILAWSQEHQLPMRGHNLFWAGEEWNPDWVKALSNAELYAAVKARASEICTRYRGKIDEYDVLNEILNGQFFQRRLGNGIIAEMFNWCQAADPNAVLYTNEYNILSGEQLQAYYNLVRSLLEQHIPVRGIGIQAHIRQPITAAQIQASLDRLAELGLPLKITEFSAVAATPAEQARILIDVYRVAFAHPAVTGIYMWGFWDGAIWQRESALYQGSQFFPQPAAQAYQDLVQRQWWTDIQGKTDHQGVWQARAFLGNYTVQAEAAGLEGTQTFELSAHHLKTHERPLEIVIQLSS